MEILIKASQFVLSLSILIVAHEMGHFLFAKLFKVRVEKFYLFFDAGFSLFKFKKGETEYGIGWLPLGGYVKIAGMIDESMDTEQMSQPPQPWEFRTKPAWQRLLIMVGGVLVNFVLAFFIYSMILFVWGKEYIPVQNAAYGYEFSQTALENGFRNGDKIIAVDGVSYDMLADLTEQIIHGGAKNVTIERDGERMDIALPYDFSAQYSSSKDKVFASPLYPFVIDKTQSGSPAAKAGLQSGDIITAVNDHPTPTAGLFMGEAKNNADKKINLTIERNGMQETMDMTVSESGTIGVYCQLPTKILKSERIEYGFFESIPAGIVYGVDILSNYVGNLGKLFNKGGLKQLGGFIAIGNIFPAEWDWLSFWTMTAFLSIILAFMNILPIPALDGGHVLFLLFEMITGRKPGDKFLERAQIVGMVILIGLLLIANGNDIIRLFSR
ncbi:MAG: RIP metalloprotease RseP [Bacteroidales bacterium]|jgi:regulator of sigma E protease|nr:RIP metalloprotease RseP [Bacteroidales bacterium]